MINLVRKSIRNVPQRIFTFSSARDTSGSLDEGPDLSSQENEPPQKPKPKKTKLAFPLAYSPKVKEISKALAKDKAEEKVSPQEGVSESQPQPVPPAPESAPSPPVSTPRNQISSLLSSKNQLSRIRRNPIRIKKEKNKNIETMSPTYKPFPRTDHEELLSLKTKKSPSQAMFNYFLEYEFDNPPKLLYPTEVNEIEMVTRPRLNLSMKKKLRGKLFKRKEERRKALAKAKLVTKVKQGKRLEDELDELLEENYPWITEIGDKTHRHLRMRIDEKKRRDKLNEMGVPLDPEEIVGLEQSRLKMDRIKKIMDTKITKIQKRLPKGEPWGRKPYETLEGNPHKTRIIKKIRNIVKNEHPDALPQMEPIFESMKTDYTLAYDFNSFYFGKNTLYNRDFMYEQLKKTSPWLSPRFRLILFGLDPYFSKKTEDLPFKDVTIEQIKFLFKNIPMPTEFLMNFKPETGYGQSQYLDYIDSYAFKYMANEHPFNFDGSVGMKLEAGDILEPYWVEEEQTSILLHTLQEKLKDIKDSAHYKNPPKDQVQSVMEQIKIAYEHELWDSVDEYNLRYILQNPAFYDYITTFLRKEPFQHFPKTIDNLEMSGFFKTYEAEPEKEILINFLQFHSQVLIDSKPTPFSKDKLNELIFQILPKSKSLDKISLFYHSIRLYPTQDLKNVNDFFNLKKIKNLGFLIFKHFFFFLGNFI